MLVCILTLVARSRSTHNVRVTVAPRHVHFVLNGTTYFHFIVKMYWIRSKKNNKLFIVDGTISIPTLL